MNTFRGTHRESKKFPVQPDGLSNSQTVSRETEREFYRRSKQACADLFRPNATIFWVDFIASVLTAYICASVYLASDVSSILGWACFAVSVVTMYRASMFIHEIVHLPKKEMVTFRRFWNFFAGVPMMVPTFTYQSHLHHHSSQHYGTDHDGEYLPFASGTFRQIGVYLFQIVMQPLLVYFRYLVWTPISFLHPKLRRWTLANASSLVINFRYRNAKQPDHHTAEDTFWEWMTWFRAAVMIALVLAGVMPWIRLPKILLLAMTVLTINHLRTLAAHRYRNDGNAISHLDQFMDSTNITGRWWTELWCPLGLRYHALHHLFPGIPYHNLGKAHRRLLQLHDDGSIYHRSVYDSFQSVVRELFEEIRRNQEETRLRPESIAEQRDSLAT